MCKDTTIFPFEKIVLCTNAICCFISFVIKRTILDFIVRHPNCTFVFSVKQ